MQIWMHPYHFHSNYLKEDILIELLRFEYVKGYYAMAVYCTLYSLHETRRYSALREQFNVKESVSLMQQCFCILHKVWVELNP